MAESIKERWTCMGVRVTTADKRATKWLMPNHDTVIYVEKASFITGGIYEIDVERKDGHTYRGTPVYVGRLELDHPDRRQWVVEELTAEQELARLARERKAKKDDPLGRAMTPLAEYARACRTITQRDALIADVTRRLAESWFKG